MLKVSRREFVAAGGAALAVSALGPRARAAAGDRIRHAVIGTGGQGGSHARVFSSCDDCEVAAICDLDPERRAQIARALPNSESVIQTDDYRRILDDKTIDTISIATPDHWHTPIALAGLAAGKHVYVEKPCSHNVYESKVLIDAAAKTGLCVQHGTQSRSGQGIMDAIKFVHEGNIGKVRLAKAINHQFRGPIGRAPVQDPPEGVNYDRWIGPAPVKPFTQNRWHYNWHWIWDFGTGDIGNDGIHQIDVARWGLGVGLPQAISASGGQLFYDDDHETPDTQVVTFEYPGCYLLFEMRLWTDYPLEGHDNGVIFYGDKGTVEVGRQGCFVKLIDQEPQKLGGSHDLDANVRNFLACSKSNDPSSLNAPISEGAVSSALSHLGNVATRVGRRLHFDAENWTCTNDDEAAALMKRTYREGYELPVV